MFRFIETVWGLLALLIIWGVWDLQKRDSGFNRWLWGKPPRSRKPKRSAVNQPMARTTASSTYLPGPLDRLADWAAEKPWYVQLLMWQFVLTPLAAIKLAFAFFGAGILLYFASGGGAP